MFFEKYAEIIREFYETSYLYFFAKIKNEGVRAGVHIMALFKDIRNLSKMDEQCFVASAIFRQFVKALSPKENISLLKKSKNTKGLISPPCRTLEKR